MRDSIKGLRIAGLALMLPASVALAQMPPAPKPGPEHEMLKRDVGVWDATVEMQGPPGTPASVSKGTETVSLIGGGLWQITEFKGEIMGQPFEGRGATGYDPSKKKYVGTWVDSMTAGLSTVEATLDSSKRVMTGTMEGTDPTGAVSRMKEVTEWKDADNRVFTLYIPLPDGKEIPVMKITYKRRK
jgi:Protein of unknown function (DUF1579)